MPVPGDESGPFHVERPIGRGSTSVVVLGRKGTWRAALQLTTPNTFFTSTDEQRARYFARIRACEAVRHDSLVGVHGGGRWNAWTYVVLDFIDGVPLDQWLSASPRSWRDVVSLVLPVAAGLARAHDVGLLHSALNLRQILVRPDGSPALKGLWQGQPPMHEHEWLFGDASTTSPERIAQRGYAAPSDQFGLGALFWRALFGTWRFDGPDILTVYSRISNNTPAAPPVGHDVPLALVDVLLRAMHPVPEQRWSDLREFAERIRLAAA